MTDIKWALTEPADATLIECDPELIRNVFLFTRVDGPGAFVMTFDEPGVLVNGVFQDLGEDLMSFCSMTDEILMNLRGPEIGRTVRTEPFKD